MAVKGTAVFNSTKRRTLVLILISTLFLKSMILALFKRYKSIKVYVNTLNHKDVEATLLPLLLQQ